MHLIQGKLSGKEVPSKLPQTLIPPSMRTRASQVVSQPQVPEGIRDLIWDETPPPSATTSQPIAPVFPPPPAARTISPQHTAAQPTTSIFGGSDPFASTSFTIPAPGE